MKLGILLLLPLAVAFPAPKPERHDQLVKNEPRVLHILGINGPALLPGLAVPIIGEGSAPNASPSPPNPSTSWTPTQPSKPIPTDKLNELLTPILENLGAPEAEAKALNEMIKKLLANNGLPVGDLTNPLPAIVTPQFLEEVGKALKQILMTIAPTQPTNDLVNQLITTLQDATQIKKPRPVLGRPPAGPPPPPPNAGVVPGVETLVNAALNALKTIDPKTSTVSQIQAAFKDATSQLDQAAKVAPTDQVVRQQQLQDLLGQLFTVLTNLLKGLPVQKQTLLTTDGLTLFNSLGGLLGKLTTLYGIDTGVLGNLLQKLLGGLTPGGSTVGNGLTRLLDSVIGNVLHY